MEKMVTSSLSMNHEKETGPRLCVRQAFHSPVYANWTGGDWPPDLRLSWK